MSDPPEGALGGGDFDPQAATASAMNEASADPFSMVVPSSDLRA
jgi:hypothetical protein